MYEFFIPVEVEPKQADRSRTVVPRHGGRPFIQHYQPAKVTKNAKDLALYAKQYAPDEPLSGPVSVCLTFLFAWRKSESKREKERGSKPKDVKPDLDNLDKQMLDVLQASGFFHNDSQVVLKRSSKFWADSPGVEVSVEGFSDE